MMSVRERGIPIIAGLVLALIWLMTMRKSDWMSKVSLTQHASAGFYHFREIKAYKLRL